MIKFWSYQREYQGFKKILLKSIDKSIKRGPIFFGEELKKFEKKFIKTNNGNYGAAVGSGTDALIIALKSINIKKNDEVITVANTAIPTISAIINVGAKPKLVDIGEDYLIDVTKIESLINSKTKAIIPVHLYGQSCDMDVINRIAKKHNLKVIEDCAQAQGAKFKGKFVGTIGDIGCFSFYPTKILGAYGDGGFVLTKNFQLYKKIKRLRFYGIETIDKKNKFFNDYYANENGINSRLGEIQASILNLKLNYIDSYIEKRREIAKFYIKNLENTKLILPTEITYKKHVYHLFTIYHPKANEIIEKMSLKKIELRKVYPHPIHLMKAYKEVSKLTQKYLLNTNFKSKGIFCLPLYPNLKLKEMHMIVNSLKKILLDNKW
jgi:dTDP-3-amino-2,3,6-trideoxy-4-keto-D-glucose/dTDP-3-amino-3,4,6-trideoxy-alpha-D-glucose/dTDP-2,6-dideoxy-D-kanosamine transaminase